MAILSEAQLAAIDLAVGWPVAAVPDATAIEEQESGGNPAAVSSYVDNMGGNPYQAVGLFQIESNKNAPVSSARNWQANLSPTQNSADALALYNQSGWQPWTGDYGLAGSQGSWSQRQALGAQALAQAEKGGATPARHGRGYLPTGPSGGLAPAPASALHSTQGSPGGGVLNDIIGAVLSPLENVVIRVMLFILGLVLVAWGLDMTFKGNGGSAQAPAPASRTAPQAGPVGDVAEDAAEVAA